ncbi:MAG: hypothetical protein K0B15_01525 [Lentimicrobium sp.]|nr:hypothetical protein [Lentimicrobium sp.]
MKKLMILMLVVISLPFMACSSSGSETANDATAVKPAKIEVYYFHYTRRCMTCNAVEDVTKNALNEMYADKMKSGEITFLSVNLEEKYGEAIANRLKVAAQALIVVNDGKQTDLTDKGFMYAKSSPDKLKSELKKAIDGK